MKHAALALLLACAAAAPARAETVIWERPGAAPPKEDGAAEEIAAPALATESQAPARPLLELQGYGGGAATAVFHPKTLLRMTEVLATQPERERLRVGYRVREVARVRAEVSDASGRAVRVFEESFVNPGGSRALEWDGTDASGAEAPSGVYRVALTAAPAAGGGAAETRVLTVDVRSPAKVELGLPAGDVDAAALPSGIVQIPYAAPGPVRMSAYVLAYNEAEDRFEVQAPLLGDRKAESGTLSWQAAGLPAGVYYLLVLSSADAEAPLPEPATRIDQGRPVRAEIRALRLRGPLSRAADLLGADLATSLAALARAASGAPPPAASGSGEKKGGGA